MVFNSVNTNAGALAALASLNRTQQNLQDVQKRVSTGFRVNDAVDDGAGFAVAQKIRGVQASIGAVNQQLSIAQGVVGVALEAATNISNTVIKARETITRLADSNLSTDQRNQYSQDLSRLVTEIQNFRNNAIFNGTNLLSVTATDRSVISNYSGETFTLTARRISESFLHAVFVSGAGGAADGTFGDYRNILTQSFVTLETNVLNALNSLGGDSRRLTNQLNFNQAQLTAQTLGLGAIVDADLARESARLQAFQVQQQLGTQTLGIANQNPQALLGLFRN